MSALQAKLFLFKLAKQYRRIKDNFSRAEILQKINQIKSMADDRKSSKMDIKKEIIHLENQFNYVTELEKALARQKKLESAKVTSLKKEISDLKRKLFSSKQKDLHKKVEKLSFLVGDALAKKSSKKEIETKTEIKKERKIEPTKQKLTETTTTTTTTTIKRNKIVPKSVIIKQIMHPEMTEEDEIDKIKHLQEKLDEMKAQVNLSHQSTEMINLLSSKIKLIESKLNEYYLKYPQLKKDEIQVSVEIIQAQKENPKTLPKLGGEEIIPAKHEIKHDLLFSTPPSPQRTSQASLEIELPLPPPPRVKKKE